MREKACTNVSAFYVEVFMQTKYTSINVLYIKSLHKDRVIYAESTT